MRRIPELKCLLAPFGTRFQSAIRNRQSAIVAGLLLIISLSAPVTPSTQPKNPPHWPMFRKHLLDTGANESAAVADINQDGRLDIICGENWFEAPEWKKHRMREIPFIQGYIDDLSNFSMDVNDDGYPDVVASSWFSKKMSWFENPKRHDGEMANVLWKEHVIETGFNYEIILVTDIDGDGKAHEILPNYGTSGEIAWFERSQPYSKGEWTRRRVGKVPDVKGVHGIGAGDVNRDGHPDILTPFGWFEAPTNPRTGSWSFHAEYRLVPTSPICVLDVNGDGKNDLVYGAGHDYGVFWLENKGGGKWQEHLIDDSWSQAHPMVLVDMDHDGKLDVVTGKRYLAHDSDPGAYEPLGLYWYRLGGSGQFVKHLVDYGSNAGAGVQTPVVDIDGDRDLDLVAPGKSGLFLFEQVDFKRQSSHS